MIGSVPDLPSDMADQHDHYLHGAPEAMNRIIVQRRSEARNASLSASFAFSAVKNQERFHATQRPDCHDHWLRDQGPSCGLGPGLLESAYRVCLAYELTKLGIPVEQEKPIPVIYDDVKLECGFRADLLVAGQAVVECKAKDKLHPVDQAQITSHLRLLDLRVGLLINFHEPVLKNGIRRIVNNYQED